MIQVDKPPWRGSRWRGAATDRRGPVLWAALMSLAALHASALPGHTRAAALSLRATPGVPRTSGVLTLGVMVTLRGPFAALGVEGLRGVALAVAEVHGRVGATRIAVAVAGTAGTPATATAAGRTLLDRDGATIVVGPSVSTEVPAYKALARRRPGVVFVDGSAVSEELTLFDPVPNVYRFTVDGAQGMAGLGTYAYRVRGYRRVAVIGDGYASPFTQARGFLSEFCRVGGRVPTRIWAPVGTRDYRPYIDALPMDVDALYVAFVGADSINFLIQYVRLGGRMPIVAATDTVDQAVLNAKGRVYQHVLDMPSASSIADDNATPAWRAFVAAYRTLPGANASPSKYAFSYYVNTKAALLALTRVRGDLSHGEAALKGALARLRVDTPAGPVYLDHNRNAVAASFLTVVTRRPDGTLYNRVIGVTPHVTETLGQAERLFVRQGPPHRANLRCP